MHKTLYFDFGKITLFDKFVVMIIDEGVNVIPEYNEKLIKIAEEYYKDQYFGYIGYRKNSYSINPLVYLECSKINNLVAMAVACPRDGIMLKNVIFEKHFLSKPFKDFTNLDEAKNWILELVIKKESEDLKPLGLL